MRKRILFTAALLLAGCNSTTTERYDLADDIAPEYTPDVVHLENAQPRYEPYSLAGNKDYTLRGQSYQIITDTEGFTEQGDASWYGKKFHGHLTSNGEVYDMYSMTAAHKTLPLPSYVKVTNLQNEKTVIVRVNDRGPFHEGRIIDLSYAAAKRIGSLEKGTVPVNIEVITVPKPGKDEVHTISPNHYYVQLAAVSQPDAVIAKAAPLAQSHSTKVISEEDPDRGLFRVRLGPFNDRHAATQAQAAAKQHGFTHAYIITVKRPTAKEDGVVAEASSTIQFGVATSQNTISTPAEVQTTPTKSASQVSDKAPSS
uniref:septal ring lytic transglycosylase RlpA family protein n=1 Tax=Thaumasiovibrio subtropicus TaxID=1891207 RepID=UPI000B360185|nr:septal ring lytic transglycosylase RlpA family protein [Thaumasiovibrio subtropicus]